MSDEDQGERINRELMELLNELRVALPGVQVLFAFLLTIPFTPRYSTLNAGDRRVLFGAVVATAISSALFIAPSAHHRLRFRQRAKEQLLRVSNALAIAGMFFLAVAVSCAMYVVTQALYATDVASIAAAMVGGLTALLWFVVPLLYRSE